MGSSKLAGSDLKPIKNLEGSAGRSKTTRKGNLGNADHVARKRNQVPPKRRIKEPQMKKERGRVEKRKS
ncbi:hypothetical protein SLA2020_413080 [Shorea laevis]